MTNIRQASDSDREALGNVYYQGWTTNYRGILPQSFLDGLTPEGAQPKAINPKETLVIFKDQELIGVSKFGPSRWPEFDGFGEIVTLYILPEYQGKGYGKMLFQAVVEQLLDRGFRQIHLWVLEGNHSARAFYEAQGFQLCESVQQRAFHGEMIQEVSYQFVHRTR